MVSINFKDRYNGTIAESLTPTYENITREFITRIMPEILLNKEKTNFNFAFNESEAIKFIKEVIARYTEERYSGFKKTGNKILKALTEKRSRDNNLPSLVINDYKSFFESLRQYYEKDIELFFERTKASGFMVYEMKNCFEQIWLRATPEDFNNPEKFLERQVQYINDDTFSKFDKEKEFGPAVNFNEHIVCASIGISRTWDETPWQFNIKVYDKEHYANTNLYNRPHYNLPVIRYGIYEKDGKKVCNIGAIQSGKDEKSYEVKSVSRRACYAANQEVKADDQTSVEPSQLIALSIFINFLHKEGITEIEVPGLYTLDYQFHQKRNITMQKEFENDWTGYKQKEQPDRYKEEKKRLESMVNKEDIISKNKTERLIQTFIKLTDHYPNSKIQSYAGDVDNYLHLSIPQVKEKKEIKGGLLQEMYGLVEGIYERQKEDEYII